MKHIELIKSIILTLLVALSITLTFSIWTYTPKLDVIEQPPTVDISIAEKQDLSAIIKPYKILFNFEEDLRGTVNPDKINQLLNRVKTWSISNLSLEDQNFDEENMAEFMRKKNQFTFFFHGEVPLPVYDNILNIKGSDLPEISFNRIVVEWNSSGVATDVHFISETNHLRYKAKVKLNDAQNFQRAVLDSGRSYPVYEEVAPESTKFIVVPVDEVELIQNTFYQEETSPSKFRDALFNDPNAVRRSLVDVNLEEYQDNHALMTIETVKKTLNYVHPVAESKEMAIPSELLLDTVDFVNEHDGWTDEYRFMYMNPLQRKVKFQLYAHGLPVWSDSTMTEIEQVWGEDQIFKYGRPYYTLELTPLSGTVTLPSGLDVANILRNSASIDFNLIDEIMPAYYMKNYEENSRLFMLDPSWYYLINGNWYRLSPEQLGGETIGLE